MSPNKSHYLRVWLMKIRSHIDQENDLPHIYEHNVSEDEVEDVLRRPGEDLPGREGVLASQ